MKQYIQEMINALIAKNTTKASEALSEYLEQKIHHLIITEALSENDFIPKVTSTCDDVKNTCEIIVTFKKHIDDRFTDKVFMDKHVVDIEKSVGGVADDKILGPNSWLIFFNDVPNPREFAGEYKKAITKAASVYAEQHLSSDDNNEIDDFDEPRSSYDKVDADRAEAKWWDERNSSR